MLHDMNYKFSADARARRSSDYIARAARPSRMFSNARSIRNALDRIRLRQANRLVADLDRVMTARRHHVPGGGGCACQPGVLEGQMPGCSGLCRRGTLRISKII